jgi:hypothetical protein
MTNSPGKVPASEVVVTDFQRRAGKAVLEDIAPIDIEAAIGGLQVGDVDAFVSQEWNPAAVGTQARPAGAAKRKQRRIAVDSCGTIRGLEDEAVIGKACPAMACHQLDALRFQPSQPGAQQRRGLHHGWKDPAGRADEGFRAETEAQARTSSGVKASSAVRRRSDAVSEPGGEVLIVLGMGDVEAGFAGEQEFAAECRHAIIDRHGMTGQRQHLRCHQARRSAADDCDLFS